MIIRFKYSSVYIPIPNYPFLAATVSSFSKSAFSLALYSLFEHTLTVTQGKIHGCTLLRPQHTGVQGPCCTQAGCRRGAALCVTAQHPVPTRVHLVLPGYEPLAPLPSAAASVPVWQDRTIASSRLRLLEYSAFMEVQRDPDTVPWGWGQGLCGPGPPLRVMGLGHRGVGGGLSPCSLSPPRPGACTLVCSPDPVLGPPHSTANTCLCTSARRTPPSQTRPWRQWMCVRYTTSSPRRRVA